MGGTFDLVPNGGSRTQYTACGRNGSGDVAGTCTLLGPEGPDALDLQVGADEPQGLFWLPTGHAEKVPPVL